MLLYSLLWLNGYPEITIEDLKHFRKVGSPTAGHPEHGDLPGIETTTGPLGQGIANAVGMALAERILNARFGDELVDHKTYVIASDGDLMEGISQEAHRPGRPPEAEEPDRAVGPQQHHHRRLDPAVGFHRPDEALRSLGLDHRYLRRP